MEIPNNGKYAGKAKDKNPYFDINCFKEHELDQYNKIMSSMEIEVR
jgi:hypothetical protein